MSLKRLYNNVRKWIGEAYNDKEIESVLEFFYHNEIYYPEDFFVATKTNTLQEADKKLYIQRVDALFDRITERKAIPDNRELAMNLHKIIWGLVMVAKFGDQVQTIVPYDVKGSGLDTKAISGIDFPIPIQKTKEIVDYLKTKKIHSPIAMYQDLRHTRQFLDLQDDVLAVALASYTDTGGRGSIEQIHQDIKSVFLSPSLNKRGGKL